MKTITINDFYKKHHEHWAYTVHKVIEAAKEDTVIEFEKGTYYFDEKYAFEKHCYITNNDHSVKRIAFPVINKKNIVINGNGSDLIFTGRIIPFYLSNSENITIKNFSIDYVRPFYTQGEIMKATNTSAVLKIDKEAYPYRVNGDVITFIGDHYESNYVHYMLEFEKLEKRPIDGSRESFTPNRTALKGAELESGVLRIDVDFNKIPEVGKMMVIKHEKRFVPGIVIDHSRDVTIDSVIIKQAGTMGVVGQYSNNISLESVVVATDETSERVVSANADATHFVGCSGTLMVQNCRFESQLDDAINVHGNYLEIDKVIDENTVIAKIGHHQQVGLFGLQKGTLINLIEGKTMLTVQHTSLIRKEIMNNQYVLLRFKDGLHLEEGKRYCIEDRGACPELIFRNNYVAKNRARGLLLTSGNTMLIEKNTIIAEGSAIKVNGDTDNWYESGAISELIIRDNYLESINKRWGTAVIDLDPGMKQVIDNKPFHGHVSIENNRICLHERPLLYGYSFKDLRMTNNRFIVRNKKQKEVIEINHYQTSTIEDNDYEIVSS